MKRLLLICFAFTFAAQATDLPTDPTEKYRNKKAHEAIIHDAYYEAEKITDVPAAWREAEKAFGYKEGDIEYYRAVRTNKFVERVGNKLIILWPNFQMYATPEEQKVYIGLQLASLQQDVEMDLGGSHETFCNSKIASISFRKKTIAATAVGLLALYHKQIVEQSRKWAPTVKNVMFSPGMALVAGCWIANEAEGFNKRA